MIDHFGWKGALIVFAAVTLIIVPLAIALATPRVEAPSAAPAPTQSFRQAISEAFAHRSYLLLVLGFFTCGFQLAFTTVDLPS